MINQIPWFSPVFPKRRHSCCPINGVKALNARPIHMASCYCTSSAEKTVSQEFLQSRGCHSTDKGLLGSVENDGSLTAAHSIIQAVTKHLQPGQWTALLISHQHISVGTKRQQQKKSYA